MRFVLISQPVQMFFCLVCILLCYNWSSQYLSCKNRYACFEYFLDQPVDIGHRLKLVIKLKIVAYNSNACPLLTIHSNFMSYFKEENKYLTSYFAFIIYPRDWYRFHELTSENNYCIYDTRKSQIIGKKRIFVIRDKGYPIRDSAR